MLSLESLGDLFIMSSSAFSVPRAKAGKQSVIKLIHNKWTGFKITKPTNVAKNIATTSLKLDDNKNWIDFLILS